MNETVMPDNPSVSVTSFRRRIWQGVLWLLFAVFVLVFVVLNLGTLVPLVVLWKLLTGWIDFLQRVLPQVSARGGQLPMFALTLGVVLGGLHWFLDWLRRHQRAVSDDGAAKPPWRFRWTAAIAGLIAASTLLAMAGIGIIHQTGWMLVSTEPVWVMRSSGMGTISVARTIDGAIEMEYAEGRLAPKAIPASIPDYGRLRDDTGAYRVFALSDETGDYAGLIVLPRPESHGVYRSVAVMDGPELESYPPESLPELVARYGHRMHPLQ